MTHGVHRRSARSRRTRRRIRRGEMRQQDSYRTRYGRWRFTWNRRHPRFKKFSFGNHVRGFGRKGKRKQ